MSGIACAGNWILDQVKTIDCWPRKGELANVLAETLGAGGSPFNVLIDFRRLRAPFRTVGFGCIGKDGRGDEIMRICRREGVDVSGLRRLPSAETSYTDVMSVAGTGERTFFHCRGANSFFSGKHVDLPLMKKRGIRIFHLGYLLLLDALDRADGKFGTRGAVLLRAVRAAGIQTSVDVVTETSDRYRKIVIPALRFTDHLIINEMEAEKIASVRIRSGKRLDRAGMRKAAERLFRLGVERTVVIHAPEGLFWKDSAGHSFFMRSLVIPGRLFKGAVGAGDALCAGVLMGLHEGWPPRETARVATGVAAACITEANTTDGVRPLKEIRRLCRAWSGERG